MHEAAEGGRRIAFFGGSFDPPHLGHIGIARAAQSALQLDTVLFAPVGVQPLKPLGSTASFEDRVAMTELAIKGLPQFAICFADAPDPTGEPNYTIDTLHRLEAQFPSARTFHADRGRLIAQPWPLVSGSRSPFCGASDRCLAAGTAA